MEPVSLENNDGHINDRWRYLMSNKCRKWMEVDGRLKLTEALTSSWGFALWLLNYPLGGRGGTVGTAASQLQGPWFYPKLGLLPVWSFVQYHVFPVIQWGSFQVLQFLQTYQKQTNGVAKPVCKCVWVCSVPCNVLPSKVYSQDGLRMHRHPDQDKVFTKVKL